MQSLKAPWVDECYSYYGVWHDSFSEFYDSMLTGINFSPPLYFLFNFCIQLIFPTSIEKLRIQSLVFIIIGIVLSFLLTRKIFGNVTTFVAIILVVSQSNLLLSQAQEARHYAMFFACGGWVLYMQNLDGYVGKKYNWLTFLAHFCLCQVHYMGIIFSFLSGFAYFLTSRNTGLWKRVPISITMCWLVSIVSYLFYLTKQKSVLNNWPKPNGLSNLISSYNDSLLILTILIPVLAFIITNGSNRDTESHSIGETSCSRPIIFTSILWVTVPFILWILSIISSMNLFVDRYFIPKETAVIFLVAYGFSLILKNLPKNNFKCASTQCAFVLSVIILLISTKRMAFGLNKTTNYHHSLIIKGENQDTSKTVTLIGDQLYFPNAYLRNFNFDFDVDSMYLLELYKRFSKKIKFSKE